MYPTLIASTVTAVFVIIVDVIILATGILTLSLPVLWIVKQTTGWNPSIDVSFLRRSSHEQDTQHTDSEPVPAPREQDPPPPEPETDDRTRPLLDLIGHLSAHLVDQRHDDNEEMEPIDIRDPADDTYRSEDNENDDDDW